MPLHRSTTASVRGFIPHMTMLFGNHGPRTCYGFVHHLMSLMMWLTRSLLIRQKDFCSSQPGNSIPGLPSCMTFLSVGGICLRLTPFYAVQVADPFLPKETCPFGLCILMLLNQILNRCNTGPKPNCLCNFVNWLLWIGKALRKLTLRSFAVLLLLHPNILIHSPEWIGLLPCSIRS